MSFTSTTMRLRQDAACFQFPPHDSLEPSPIIAASEITRPSMLNVYNNMNNMTNSTLSGSTFPGGADGILSSDFFTAKCDFTTSQQENILRLRSSLNNLNNRPGASFSMGSVGQHHDQQQYPKRNCAGPSSINAAFGASQTSSLQNLNNCYSMQQRTGIQEQSGGQQQPLLFVPQQQQGCIVDGISTFDSTPSMAMERVTMDGDHQQTGAERISNAQQSRWQQRFNDLVAFRNEYGNCCVPTHWPQNPPLAQWVKRQRYQYKLKLQGKHSTMSDSRLQVLNALGMVWDPQSVFWEERLAELVNFRETYGHCNVPTKFPDHPELAIWVKCQRRQFKIYCTHGPQKSNITPERITKLRKLGFVFSPREAKKQHNNAKNNSGVFSF